MKLKKIAPGGSSSLNVNRMMVNTHKRADNIDESSIYPILDQYKIFFMGVLYYISINFESYLSMMIWDIKIDETDIIKHAI